MTQNVKLHALKSFYSREMGLVTLDDDVLGIVARVKEITDGQISVELDPVTGWYHLVEHCEDKTDRLVFSVEELDQRVLERLMRADSQNRYHEDPYAAAEREQDELQAARDDALKEQINEAGEELVFQLQKGGLAPRLPVQVFVPRGLNAHR